MAAYKDLIGQKITKVTSNPGEPKTGQMWYNSTDGKLRGLGIVKAFTSSSAYLSELFGQGGAGSQTSALSFGGAGSPGSTVVTTTGEYNGSGWATGGAMSTARRSMIGLGIQTAALGSTGYSATGNQSASEEYDGSSWTSGGAYPVAQELGSGCGTQTAGLGCGGQPTPATSNEYNGSSWTASPGNLNDGRSFLTTVGTQTAALAAGARSSNPLNKNCEEYDGSTWTSVNSLNTTRDLVSFGAGIQTAAISYGTPGSLESYDGTNWTNEPATMGTARNSGSNAGSATAALACGGSPGGATALTEEYNVSTNTITAAAWAGGGNLNTARRGGASAGNATAHSNALYFSGYEPANSAKSEAYDGTSWSEGPDLSTGRGGARGFGVNTAAVCCAGGNPPAQNVTEEYNGSAWTAGGNLNLGRTSHNAFGTLTAGVASGGNEVGPAGNTTATELYNGTSWTTSPATLPTAMHQGGIDGAGSQTAGLVAGGDGPGSPTTAAYEFDGEAWTAGGSLITGAEGAGMNGTQTSAFFTGGNNGGAIATTQNYDGTSWSTRPSISTARYYTNGSGATAPATLLIGGWNGSANLATTEEFTGETSAANITDFTTS